MDKRLEEQLEHLRRLSERVAEIHEQIARNTELMTRGRPRGIASSPLHEVRDFRTWRQEHGRSSRNERPEPRAEAADRPRRRRRRSS